MEMKEATADAVRKLPSKDADFNAVPPSDYIDILGNGHVLKKIIKPGLGRDTRPTHGDYVTISFEGWLEDETLVEKGTDVKFVLGDGDYIHAFQLALPLTELKEEMELITDSRFAYGDLGREPEIPANAKLRYRITLMKCDDPPCYEQMSPDKRFELADEKRERGNYYFNRKEYSFALTSYSKALQILTTASTNDTPPASSESVTDSEPGPHSTDDVFSLDIKLRCNIAATQLKLEAYDAALKTCEKVLEIEPTNFKALFRKGKALVGSGDQEEAISVFRQVLELVPSSKAAAAELVDCQIILRGQRQRKLRAISRMYPELFKSDHPTTLNRIKRVIKDYRYAISTVLIAGLSVAIGAIAMSFSNSELSP